MPDEVWLARLLTQLKDDQWEIRLRAVLNLSLLDSPQVVEPLLSALNDYYWCVRQKAAASLGRLQDRRAVVPLINALNDKSWRVQEAAAFSLGLLEDTRAVVPLINALRHDRRVRNDAAIALGYLGDKQAVIPLIGILTDDSRVVRLAAVEALRRLRDTRAVAPLIAALNDANELVRSAVAEALGELEDARAVEPLLALLNDSDEGVRAAAATALGLLRNAQARDPLTSALNDVSARVRAAANAALEQLEIIVDGVIDDLLAAPIGRAEEKAKKETQESDQLKADMKQPEADEVILEEMEQPEAGEEIIFDDDDVVFEMEEAEPVSDIPKPISPVPRPHAPGTAAPSMPEPKPVATREEAEAAVGGEAGEIAAPASPPPPPASEAPIPKEEKPAEAMAEDADNAPVMQPVMDEFSTIPVASPDSALRRTIRARAIRATPVMFSAYPPKVAKKDRWQPLIAYVFRETARQTVIENAMQKLNEKQARYTQVITGGKKAIREGAEIVARPTMNGFQFKPLEVKMGFYEGWQRFDFELRAKDAPLNHFATGKLTFTVEGVIVADVPMSVYVGEESTVGEIGNTVTQMYQSIFCSYSHDDTKIVERVERAYKALGLDYLRDITSLKSGTEWNEELLKLIDRADIFQLFWSKSAAESPYVAQEWQHALKRDQDKGSFIRPVYWNQPIPSVPDALRHIHFAYQPDLDD
jgi:HEAT repeat protein